MSERSVMVCAPVKGEGRRVWVDQKLVGAARSLRDLNELLRCGGWEGLDKVDVADLPVIEWHGGGPEVRSAQR
ncbi:hypothetical protein ACWC6I_44605 [Streptomyces sp. NPDC001414]